LLFVGYGETDCCGWQGINPAHYSGVPALRNHAED